MGSEGNLSSAITFSRQDHLKTCAFEEVHCTNPECNEVLTRRTLQYHLLSKCRWRIVSCHFCSEMYTYKDSKVRCKSEREAECATHPTSVRTALVLIRCLRQHEVCRQMYASTGILSVRIMAISVVLFGHLLTVTFNIK